jgi:hypothetical protein
MHHFVLKLAAVVITLEHYAFFPKTKAFEE